MKRAWFRYSLRTGFAFVSVLALFLGLWMHGVSIQRALVQRLNQHSQPGTCVVYDYEESALERRHFVDVPAPYERYPAGLVDLLGQDAFVTVVGVFLEFYHGPIDDRLVNLMCKHRPLKYIRLDGAELTRTQLERLQRAHPNSILDLKNGMEPIGRKGEKKAAKWLVEQVIVRHEYSFVSVPEAGPVCYSPRGSGAEH